VATVIDEATLLAILTTQASALLLSATEAGQIVTTSSWYYRLYRAVHDPHSSGVFSRQVAALPQPVRDELYEALDDLPTEISVLGPRLVVPVMGSLHLARPVNHLTAEALAVALISRAGIRIATDSPPFERACGELGISLEIRSPYT
jgi:hypothetical protein